MEIPHPSGLSDNYMISAGYDNNKRKGQEIAKYACIDLYNVGACHQCGTLSVNLVGIEILLYRPGCLSP